MMDRLAIYLYSAKGKTPGGMRVASSLDKAEMWASKRDEEHITGWNGLLMFGGDHHETEIG
jgi:hypothetical protein